MGQGIAHGDIDRSDLLRKGIEQREKQLLVRQEDGGREEVGGAFLPDYPLQDVVDVLGLAYSRRDGDRLYPGRSLTQPSVLRQRVEGGIAGDIVLHEEGGFVGRVADSLAVVVPVEVPAAEFLKSLEEGALAAVRGIESYEHRPVIAFQSPEQVRVALLETFGHRAVYHALVGLSPALQQSPQTGVDAVHAVPHSQELLFLAPLAARDGHPPERGYGLPLGRTEVVVAVLYLLEVLDVRKKSGGIGHVFVDVVEVGQDHLAAVDEIVETLVEALHLLPVHGVEPVQEGDAVERMEA